MNTEINNQKSTFLPIKGKPLSPFISKLKLLLNDEKFRRAIKWSENGSAIVISDGETFKKLVLDRSEEMFKTRNFTSFVRQLNLYGFRKVPVNGKGDPSNNMKFAHVNFQREKPERMHLVKRTCSSRKKKKPDKRPRNYPVDRELMYNFKLKRSRSCEEEGSGTEGDIESERLSECSSARSTPIKDALVDFSPSNGPFDKPENAEQAALQEFMHQKVQEEHMVVQLLLSLKNTVTNHPSNDVFPSNPVPGPASAIACYQASCSMPPYYFPGMVGSQHTSPAVYGHYNPV